MRSSLNNIVFAAAAFGAVAIGSTGAGAAPMNGLAPSLATSAAATNIEQARIVCGPYRCFRRPDFYYGPRPYFAPRPFYRPYPYYRPYGFYGRPFGWGGYRRF